MTHTRRTIHQIRIYSMHSICVAVHWVCCMVGAQLIGHCMLSMQSMYKVCSTVQRSRRMMNAQLVGCLSYSMHSTYRISFADGSHMLCT